MPRVHVSSLSGGRQFAVRGISTASQGLASTIVAVMLYAIKSKKVDLKFARQTKLRNILGGLPPYASNSSTYAVLICVTKRCQHFSRTSVNIAKSPTEPLFPIFTFGVSKVLTGTFEWTADRLLDDLAEVQPMPNWQALVSL
jgi:hypothetical protein